MVYYKNQVALLVEAALPLLLLSPGGVFDRRASPGDTPVGCLLPAFLLNSFWSMSRNNFIHGGILGCWNRHPPHPFHGRKSSPFPINLYTRHPFPPPPRFFLSVQYKLRRPRWLCSMYGAIIYIQFFSSTIHSSSMPAYTPLGIHNACVGGLSERKPVYAVGSSVNAQKTKRCLFCCTPSLF